VRILLSLATAIIILAVSLLLLFTPYWTHFALRASGGGDAIFATPAMAAQVSDQTISEVLFGPGTFAFEGPGGQPMYTPDERAHMRDVRTVFYGFMLVAVVSLVFLVASLQRRPRDAARWSAVARGGIWLIVAMIVIGLFAFFAFDTVFLLFHEIFFPGGNFSFPDNSNLIRLYPEPFWELTSAALGTLAISGGLVVWFLARRRARALA
jgi:integral membrane protein (TIGR01906 family)